MIHRCRRLLDDCRAPRGNHPATGKTRIAPLLALNPA
jgi:hypothetical protein